MIQSQPTAAANYDKVGDIAIALGGGDNCNVYGNVAGTTPATAAVVAGTATAVVEVAAATTAVVGGIAMTIATATTVHNNGGAAEAIVEPNLILQI